MEHYGKHIGVGLKLKGSVWIKHNVACNVFHILIMVPKSLCWASLQNTGA